jgi:NAD(P)-dependent dehydrogenase (short-subunit alcohol dehydrogenase family)
MADVNLQGKIALVTGSTSGIGKVTARELARQGATVVIVSRTRAKGEATLAEIKLATGNEQIDLLIADLNSQADIRRLAEEFKQKYSQLHILINNAGGINQNRAVTPEGFEATFATNYLAPFLLTELLLDTLKASAPARVVNVSSTAHVPGKINFDDLQAEKRYSSWTAYSQAKLALILFTYELARQLEGTGVAVNALHPGVIASNFGNGGGAFLRVGWKIMTPFILNVEKGARTTLYVATSPEVEGVTGKYFDASKEKKSSAASYNEAVRLRLWEVSTQMAPITVAVPSVVSSDTEPTA